MKINPQYKKIITNIFWLMLEHGSRILLALFLNAFLARGLGVEQYGLFQYSLHLVSVFAAIGFICGAEVVLPILVNSKGRKQHSIITNVFLLRLIFCIFSYLAVSVFVFLTGDLSQFYLILVLGAILLFGEAFNIITTWLQAQTHSKPRSIVIITASFIKCFVVYMLFSFNINNPFYYAFAWLIESVLVSFGLLLIYKKLNEKITISISKNRIYYFARKGLPFLVSLILMYAFIRLDILILKFYVDAENLGFYTSSYQLITAMVALAPILSSSLAPSLIYKNGVVNIEKRVIYISMLMFLFSLSMSSVMYFVSPYIIPFLFGQNFIGAVDIFSLLIWTMPLYFLNEGLNIYILKLGNGKILSAKWLLTLILATISYFMLIPQWGINGAILGYAIGYTTAILFSLYILFSNKYKISL